MPPVPRPVRPGTPTRRIPTGAAPRGRTVEPAKCGSRPRSPTSRVGPTILVALAILVSGCSEMGTTPAPDTPLLSVTAVSGDEQAGLPGSTLPDPLVVRAEIDGAAVPGEVVSWVVVEGGGSVYAGTSITDGDGFAREWWTLGESGPQRVEVRAVDPTTGERRLYATFTAEVVDELPDDEDEGSDDGSDGDSDDGNDDGSDDDSEPSIAAIRLEPSELALTIGGSATIQAVALDAEGDELSVEASSFAWSSSDPTVASVTDGGVVSGVSEGTATISASADGVEGTASVVVSAPDAPERPDVGEWDFVLADTSVVGDVVVPAGEAWLIGPNVKVRGNVRTTDGTIAMRPGSSLEFVGADPDRYVGGGMAFSSGVSDDYGLWVDGTGVLDIRGTPKQGWNRIGSHSTWDADDEYWISPTDRGDYTPRRWSPGNPIPRADPAAPPAEVINVTRDIVIEGPGHIHIHAHVPQRIEYVQLRNMGVSSASHGGEVLGRYALHLHHGDWGTEGTIIRGVAAIDSRGRVFVPHMSHGITMIDNVSVNSYSQALWWDEGDNTHDLVVDGFVATGVSMPRSITSTGRDVVTLGSGKNKTIRNAAASGARGGRSLGFHWDTRSAHRQESSAVWTFDRGNVAHNNEGFGIRFWFNDKWGHHVQNYVGYRNGTGGIENGAYKNAIRYTGVLLIEEGHSSTAPSHRQPVGIFHHSSSNEQAEDGGPSRYRNVEVRSPEGPALEIGRLRGTPANRMEFIDCILEPGAGHAAVMMPDRADNPFFALFRRCGITPDDIVFPTPIASGLEDSSILIEHRDGRSWEITVENGRKVVRSR